MTTQAEAERRLGVDATTLVYDTYFITKAFNINLSPLMSQRFFRLWLPYAVYLWACLRFDRFHTYFDQGLLPNMKPFEFRPLEAWLNHFLGKQWFVWTYGADVRSREVTLALGDLNCCMECPAVGKACICDEKRRRTNVRRLNRFATQTFALGDMTEYTGESRNDLFFWPVDLEEYPACYPEPVFGRPIRVVHASNHRHFKGSRFLLEAVEKLKQEGFAVELTLVERVPHEEAMKLYQQADIIADQFIIGTFGYFAIEGMGLGKPVLCYIRKQDYLLSPEECPIVNCPATQIESVLRDLLAQPARIRDLGLRGRKYVEKHFSVDSFAARLGRAYEDCGVNG